MNTLQRLHTSVTAAGPFRYLLPQTSGVPSSSAKAIYALGDANVAVAVADSISGNPATAPQNSSGGTVTGLANGGAQLTGKASIPQAAGTEIDISQGWTVWAAITIQPVTGAGVWPILVDKLYESGHGFMIFAQTTTDSHNGDQIPLFIRMSVNGADVTSAQMQIPANTAWLFGRPMLLTISNDGSGNITASIWTSNGLAAQSTYSVSIADGEGPIGSKTVTTGWRLGGLSYAGPGVACEAWGVSQLFWTNDHACIAYRNLRALALARERAWS